MRRYLAIVVTVAAFVLLILLALLWVESQREVQVSDEEYLQWMSS